ncbi:MAG: SCO family protein [Bacteroidota bacterium]
MQKKFNTPIANWSCCLLLLLGACQPQAGKDSRVETLPFFQEATFTPQWLEPDDAALDTFHRIADFALYNQQGQTITGADFQGKIYVANFFFTICPGICPKMTQNMHRLQEEFLEDEGVLLVSHSVTPEMDSVPVLQAYAQRNEISARTWHLLTGERQDIYHLGRQVYFIEEDLGLERDPDEFLHTENFVLVDQRGYIRGIYNGLNKGSVEQLMGDIYTLKREG